jgi:O-antigen/teichoic acid export membrane protein
MVAASSLYTVLLPLSSRRASRVYFRRLLWRTVMLAGVAAGFVLIVGPLVEPVIRLVLGEEYVAAADAVRIITWCFPLIVLSVWTTQVYDATGYQWVNIINGVVMTAVNVGLCWWWIPTRGPAGAAMAMVCTYVAAMAASAPSVVWVLARLREAPHDATRD